MGDVRSRAICAHMRGDDRLSLLSAQAAAALNKSIEEELATRRVDTKDRRNRGDYLDVLPALIEDEQRRVKQPARTDAIKKGEHAFPNKAAWIAALVTDLDQVAARQSGQPGGVELAGDPVIQALDRLRRRRGGTAAGLPGTRHAAYAIGAFLERFFSESHADRRLRSRLCRTERNSSDFVLRHRVYRRRSDGPRVRRAKGSRRRHSRATGRSTRDCRWRSAGSGFSPTTLQVPSNGCRR